MSYLIGQAITYAAVATTVGMPSDTFTYSWQFDDSTTATGSNVSKTWSSAGTHTATVTARDTLTGGTATATKSISVISYVVTPGALSTGDWRYGHQSVTLISDGRVAVIGGVVSNQTSPNHYALLYNPVDGTYSVLNAMDYTRYDFEATLLDSGKILITSGVRLMGMYTDYATDAWLLDAVANTCVRVPSYSMNSPNRAATKLPNGDVLVSGGHGNALGVFTVATNACEVFNHLTESFSAVTPLNIARWGHSSTLLSNGKVLIAGGVVGGGSCSNSLELFDPTTNTFSNLAATLSTARRNHSAILMNNGNVLIVGGYATGNVPLATFEVFNPSTNTVVASGNLSVDRSGSNTIELSNGSIMVLGGSASTAKQSSEIFNPVTNTFSAGPSLNAGRGSQSSSRLMNGSILVVAGFNSNLGALTASNELLDPNTLIFTHS